MNYGPPLKVERTMEKVWPNENIEFSMKMYYMKEIVEYSLIVALLSKFYGAEYFED